MKTFMRRERTGRSTSTVVTARRAISIAMTVLTLTGALLAPSTALADSRTAFLAERLKADDFRVRANAALALGATNDDDAVQPLCNALADSNEVVRQSAAAALKRLAKPASATCMRSRLAVETSDAVKLQITRALEALPAAPPPPPPNNGGGGGLNDPPKMIAGAKYYVSIGTISHNTGRPQAQIDAIVGGALKARLEALGYQVAPRVETPDAARKVIADRKMLKGFYLSVAVTVTNSGTSSTVQMKMSIASYPGKSIIADVSAGGGGSASSVDGLMGAGASSLVDTFAKSVSEL